MEQRKKKITKNKLPKIQENDDDDNNLSELLDLDSDAKFNYES